MPAPYGALAWPESRNASLVCEEDALPFPDVFFDRILIVNGSSRNDHTCPGEMSKSYRFACMVRDIVSEEPGFEVEQLP